jgi:PGF-CTERM protein
MYARLTNVLNLSRIYSTVFRTLIFSVTLIFFSITAVGEAPVGKENVDLDIKSAYNDEYIHFLFEFNSSSMEYPGIYHDYYRYEDGEWVTDGYSEDRVAMLLGDHSVNSFDAYGCFVVCHNDVRFMPDSPPSEEVSNHEYLGGVLSVSDVRKYIPETRSEPSGWDNIVSEDEIDQLRQDGVFLDLFHWRAHRSNPVGYSDSEHVLEYRHSDTGQSPYYTNWDDEGNHPTYMFNSDITGFVALNGEDVRDRNIGIDDYYYLTEDLAVSFDSEYEWQDGDTIPRQIVRVPTESRGQINANGTWSEGTWTVELVRKLDTGYPLEDVALFEGNVYYISPAVHIGDASGRDHYVTWGHSLGIGTAADIEAVKFTGQSPDWNEIPGTSIKLFYPSVISYEFLLNEEYHSAGGAACVRAGGTPPHSPEQMGGFALNLETDEPISPDPTPEQTPGFGILLAVAGLIAAMYLIARLK